MNIPNVSVSAHVLRNARRHGQCPALICSSGSTTLTHVALLDAVGRVAGGLVSRGFGKGDVLAILAPNLPDYAVAFHGAATAGGCVTTINPSYTSREVAH